MEWLPRYSIQSEPPTKLRHVLIYRVEKRWSIFSRLLREIRLQVGNAVGRIAHFVPIGLAAILDHQDRYEGNDQQHGYGG